MFKAQNFLYKSHLTHALMGNVSFGVIRDISPQKMARSSFARGRIEGSPTALSSIKENFQRLSWFVFILLIANITCENAIIV